MKKTTKFTLAMIGVALLMIIGFVFAWGKNGNQAKIDNNSRQWEAINVEITELKKEKKFLEQKLKEINTKISNKKSIQESLHELNNKLKSEGLH